jgi:hydroxymethylglutaryl-CoA lyase
MSGRYPEIVYTEEGMREGMQIEDANIPMDAKVALLDALSGPDRGPPGWKPCMT